MQKEEQEVAMNPWTEEAIHQEPVKVGHQAIHQEPIPEYISVHAVPPGVDMSQLELSPKH